MENRGVVIGRESMKEGGLEREVMLGTDMGMEGGQDALGDSMELGGASDPECEGPVLEASIKVSHIDIITIETLHDILVDMFNYSLDYVPLVRSRELTNKMYEAFGFYRKEVNDVGGRIGPTEVDFIPVGDVKMKDIKVRSLSRGYILTLGDNEVAVSTRSELISLFAEYVVDPGKIERAYFKNTR